MSEEQNPLTTAEPPPASVSGQTPSLHRRPWAQALAIVALLIALATLIGGYFVWHEVQRQATWQQQVLGQIDDRGQSLDARLQSFKDRLDSDLAAAERSRRELEATQRKLADEQTGLTAALGVLRAQVSRSRSHSDWMLAEVQYLLQVASLRVQLERDVPTASAALSSADQRLQALADPGFTGVREEIARELAALQAVALPDLPGIALTLDTLAAQVRELPLKDAQVRAAAADTAAVAATDTQGGWWQLTQQVLRTVWDALRSLVVVRHNAAPIGPLLAPEQQFFLYENLRLQLMTARLAALQGETTTYRSSLKTAGTWLDTHFDAQTAAVAAARAELERLAALDIRPTLPDLSMALRLLREQMQQIDTTQSAPADAADVTHGMEP